jgi:protein-disulfide isomerase
VLFESQNALQDTDLVAYAKQVGLDRAKFAHDLTSHTQAGKVREHFMGGVRSGVNGTPTFFINGLRHDDSFDLATLAKAIKRAAE